MDARCAVALARVRSRSLAFGRSRAVALARMPNASRSARCRGYQNAIQVGIGKSGVTTIADFFTKALGGYSLACGWNLSNVIAESLLRHEPPLNEARRRCPNFYISELLNVYTPQYTVQLQLTDLSAIRRATTTSETLFVHAQRNTSKWVSSVLRWNNLAERLSTRDLEGLPPGRGRTAEELARWYEGVNAYLRFAFTDRPNYIRVNVDDNVSLAGLARFCGREDHLFAAANVNPKQGLPVGRAQGVSPARHANGTAAAAARHANGTAAAASPARNHSLRQPQRPAARSGQTPTILLRAVNGAAAAAARYASGKAAAAASPARNHSLRQPQGAAARRGQSPTMLLRTVNGAAAAAPRFRAVFSG